MLVVEAECAGGKTVARRVVDLLVWYCVGEVEMAVDLSMSVLVVDDYSTMIRIIRNLLKQLGFENIDDASDGSAALNKMRGKKYGLVISRSEEHTSELQSLTNLVCRLLLEKKKLKH